MKRSGIWMPTSRRNFWTRVEDVFGKDYADELDGVVTGRAPGDPRAWDALNRSLTTTQATYALVSDRIGQWLIYWSELKLPEGDVIDLGCGAGLATCFYAAARPDATVTGVDASPLSLARARELSAAMKLKNVSFLEGDILDPPSTIQPAAVVVSTPVLLEAEPSITKFTHGFSSISQFADLLAGGSSSRLADVAKKLLQPNGRYVSQEWVTNQEILAKWIGALAHAGLGVDLRRSSYRVFREFKDRFAMPIVVAGPDLPHVDTKGFLSWLANQPLAAKFGSDTFTEELRFFRLGPHRFVKGWHVDMLDNHGRGATRIVVVMDNDGEPLAYITTSRGGREILYRGQSGRLEETQELAEKRVREMRRDPAVVGVRPLLSEEEW